MHIYSLYVNSKRDNVSPVIIREGFSWSATLFGFIWALYHKMWHVAAIMIFIHIVLIGMEEITHYNFILLIQILTIEVFGFFATDLQEFTLQKKNYQLKEIVFASSRMEAEMKFLIKTRNHGVQ